MTITSAMPPAELTCTMKFCPIGMAPITSAIWLVAPKVPDRSYFFSYPLLIMNKVSKKQKFHDLMDKV